MAFFQKERCPRANGKEDKKNETHQKARKTLELPGIRHRRLRGTGQFEVPSPTSTPVMNAANPKTDRKSFRKKKKKLHIWRIEHGT